MFYLAGGQMSLFAGNGTPGTTDGNAGDPTSAAIRTPTGVASYGFGLKITSMNQLGNIGSLRRYISLTHSMATDIAEPGLGLPRDVSVDEFGNGFIADYGNRRIVTTDAAIVAGDGSNGGSPPPFDNPFGGSILQPTDVALIDQSAGSLMFTSEFSTDGAVWLMAGAGDTANDSIARLIGPLTTNGTADNVLANTADLDFPSSIALLGDGGYVVYDGGHRLIRRVTSKDALNATIKTIAGNGTLGLAAPGTPADQAPLAADGDLLVTADGLVISQGNLGVIEMIPATAITSGPDALTTSHSASFTLTSWDDAATYKCTLDSQPAAVCTSGQAFPVTDGPHTMSVGGRTNGATMVDTSPAERTWTVDGTAPAPFDLGSPGDGETSGGSTFTWTASTDAGPGEVHYDLLLDGAKIAGDAITCADGSCSFSSVIPDGAHGWQVRARDDAGNVRESAARSFTQHQPPLALLSVSPNPALSGRSITFDASKSSDANGRVAGFTWDLDGDGTFETDTGSNSVTTKSFAKPATVKVEVRVTDDAGNATTAGATLVVTSLPPAGKPLGVSINDGAQYTNDPDVTVFASWPAFASTALVSNDGGFKLAQPFPVAETIPWKLDSSGPERLPKTIYVRFTGGSQTSETYQDDIILDQTPPRVLAASFAKPAGAARAAAAKKVTLKVRARDNVSGVGAAQVTANKRKPGKFLKFQESLEVKPAKVLYVRVRDRAGNLSRWRTVKRR